MNRLTCVITVAFAVTNILSGCQEKLTNLDYPASNIDTFKSTIESFSPSTKTSIGGNNRIIWSAEDLLAIFQGSAEADKFMITDDSVGTSEGEFSPVDTGNSANPSNREIKSNVAIYPYMEGLMCKSVNTNLDQSETAVTYEISNINLPSTQNYTPNSFGNGTFPMVAITKDLDDHNLKFKNIFGAIQLKLIGTEVISSIKFEGNNNEILCGQAIATVNSENTSPTITLSDTKATSVTLNCGNGVQLDESSSTSFYIALPPTDFSKGFKVTITDSENNEAVIQTNRRNIIERSSILVMPEIINGETKRTDLNIDGESANCYIISEPGTYFFQARKGNSNDKIVGIESVEVLWETFGNATKPTTGDLISSAFHLDGNIVFTTPFTFTEGNAVIAAKDANGTILWSWHIWMVEDKIINHFLANNAGVMMDRNLGATSSSSEEEGYFGLLYQWGRKDPFPSAGNNFNGSSPAATTATWPNSVKSDASTGNIAYSTQNPMQFIYCTNNSGDWVYQRDDEFNNQLWDNEKTIYDPCPIGWRVPEGGNNGAFVNADISTPTTVADGMIFTNNSFKMFYPFAGYYDFSTSSFSSGSYGWYWTTSTSGLDSKCMQIYSGGTLKKDIPYYRASGFSVRCFRDKGSDESAYGIQDIQFEHKSLKLISGMTYKLVATYAPENAQNTTLLWTSDNENVATVDSEGNVTALDEGIAKITCTATSGISKTIAITVENVYQIEKYIDNNGVDHGYGILLNGVVWAPVNCGYHVENYPNGLVYQWGRKSGHSPKGAQEANGPVSLYYSSLGNTFYKVSSSPYDWCRTPDDTFWNSGTEEEPVKSAYDPCPAGWRVPTSSELSSLLTNVSSTSEGCYFSGEYPNTEGYPRIFLANSGYKDTSGGVMRGTYGWYWSSETSSILACALKTTHAGAEIVNSRRAYGYFIRCVAADKEPAEIPLLGVDFKIGNLDLYAGEQKSLSYKTVPEDATGKITWISNSPEIATVDADGFVTGISAGTAVISAEPAGSSPRCSVTVYKAATATADYIDEYGINHGKGIKIDGPVWAPVNCGYHSDDYPYGKLYQWGRKYGQGYSTRYDATEPKYKYGPVDIETGQSEENSNYMYIYSSANNNYDWLDTPNSKLWNSGTENIPEKTIYDPCPEGWRVPTYYEINHLVENYSEWLNNEKGHYGYWFSGTQEYRTDASKVFLPTTGYLNKNGSAVYKESEGYYWSSKTSGSTSAYRLYLDSDEAYAYAAYTSAKIMSHAVRCVQE